jgi:integrative and conjugative element protein (TIGR02256 family)
MARSRSNTDQKASVGEAPMALISLAADAHLFARAEAQEHAPDETGGIVIGHAQGDTILVTRLTGPGPNAVHRPELFIRDGAYAQAMLEAAVEETDGRDDYLGEWHSHPFQQGPSIQDRESTQRISRNPNYNTPHPVLVLCRRWRRGWRFEGYRWEGAELVSMRLVEE